MLAYDESGRDDDMDANTAIAELQKMPHVSLVPAAKTIDDEKEEHKGEHFSLCFVQSYF